jgi:RimJ/RimL family protein N-acetyltransferase
MKERPTIETLRLVLRPFTLADAPQVQQLAGEQEVAATLVPLPHPYEDGMAEHWIGTHQERYEKGELLSFAIVLRATQTLMGAIDLELSQQHENAEIGYWLGKPFWQQGYATEAARAVLHYGFEVVGLHRVHANYLARNRVSARVLQKLGMREEGCLRQHLKHRGVFEDMGICGILRSEWDIRRQGGSTL